MKLKLCSVVSLMALFGVAQARATTFDLENLQIAPSYSVTGTITTDGATGALLQSDIVSWGLTINTGNVPAAVVDGFAGLGSTSASSYSGLALTVVGTGLFFNYSLSTPSFFEIGTLVPLANANVVLIDAGQGGPILQFTDSVTPQSTSSETGNVQIGSAEVSATPLPATLPLFAGGLGFVGFLTRRKKCAQAIAA